MRAAVPLPGHATASTLPPRRDVRAYSAQKVSEHSKLSTTTSAQWSRIAKIRESLLSRERSAVEIAQEHLATIERTEPILKSFIHVSDTILSEAADIDKRVANGEDIGPLAGVVVGLKDNLCTKDMPTTAASDMLRGYSPPFDATCVSKLRESGALFIGKTNMDEFGMGSSTESSAFQVTSNPWDCTRTPGGSSGGSSAAVAAHQCAVSLGSDTGGSIRQPASFCGVVGLKPTYGRVSRFGLIAYASSLDVVGCLGTSVMDTAILLEAISGQDNMDATSSRMDISSYAAKLPAINMLDSKPLKGMKVGIIQETIGDGVDREVVSCIQSSALRFEELGASIQEVSLKSFPLGLPAYYILAPSEASSNLARYDGVRYGLQVSAEDLDSMYCSSRAKGFGPEVKRRILMGTYALSAGYYDAYYKRAQQVRTLIKNDFKKALEENDFLISPAAPTPAYRKGEKVNDPLSMYAGDIMTVNVNLAGLPALVVPCGFAKNQGVDLPVGLQLIGASFDEERLLQVGHIFEQTLQNISFVPSMLGK